jgi:signal transduction histidine kinase
MQIQLVNILDSFRMETGKISVYPGTKEPLQMAQEAIDSMMPACVQKRQQLKVNGESDLPKISADFGRVVQVLFNLISNAIKYSPQGSRITVGVSRDTHHYDDYVLYSVNDNGPGLSKREQATIFDGSSNLMGGEAHKDSMGLGLRISKALIEAHGGRLWVESKGKGKGSTFYFTLPISRPPE